MKAILLFILIGILTAEAASFRSSIPDDELLLGFLGRGNTKDQKDAEPSEQDSNEDHPVPEGVDVDALEQDLQNPQGTQKLADDAINEIIQGTQDMLNHFVQRSTGFVEDITLGTANYSIEKTKGIGEMVTKFIFNNALNKTIDIVEESLDMSVGGVETVSTFFSDHSNSLFNKFLATITKYVEGKVNKTISPDGLLRDLNKITNLIFRKSTKSVSAVSNITTEATDYFIEQYAALLKKLISESSRVMKDSILSNTEGAIITALNYGSKVSLTLLEATVHKIASGSAKATGMIINGTSTRVASLLKNADLIKSFANNINAWTKINWTTGEGIDDAAITFAKILEVFNSSVSSTAGKITGGKAVQKLSFGILTMFPPTAIAIRLGRAWIRNPSLFAEIIRSTNQLAHAAMRANPVSATSASLKLIKALGSALLGRQAKDIPEMPK